MNLFKFDLASLFKAPVLPEDMTVDIDLDGYEPTPMPVEYMEIDTSFDIVTPDVEQEITIHEKMYNIASEGTNTLTLDPQPNIGGSENLG